MLIDHGGQIRSQTFQHSLYFLHHPAVVTMLYCISYHASFIFIKIITNVANMQKLQPLETHTTYFTFSGLQRPYRDTPSPVSRYYPHRGNDPRYKYIHVSPTQSLLADDQALVDEAARKFRNDPRFASRYVDEFINNELRNEIVLDLLIDVLSDVSQQVCTDNSVVSCVNVWSM